MRGRGSPNSCTTSAGRKPSIGAGRSTSRSESLGTAPELHADITRLRLAIEQLTKWAHDAGVLRTDVSWRDITVLSLASANAHTAWVSKPPMRRGSHHRDLARRPPRPDRRAAATWRSAPRSAGLTRHARIALPPRFRSGETSRASPASPCGSRGHQRRQKAEQRITKSRSRQGPPLLVLPCVTTDLVAGSVRQRPGGSRRFAVSDGDKR